MLLMVSVPPSLLVFLWYFCLSNDGSTSFGVSALAVRPCNPVLRQHSALLRHTKSSRLTAISSKDSADDPSSSRHSGNRKNTRKVTSNDDSSSSPSRTLIDNNSSKNQHAWKHQPMTFLRENTAATLLFASCVALTFSVTMAATRMAAYAAPPIAIIAEELGYFPVTNTAGETVYVPKRVQRESSQQAIELSRRLQEKGVAMAGTYWCPHTSRQKELFGKQAWDKIRYVECSPKGYNANAAFCITKQVNGYPTWLFPGGKQVSGERPLSVLAKEVGMTSFREELETNVPPLPGSACQ